MADNLELSEGEIVESEVKGDYWEKTFCMYSQKSGKYWLTNKRILFRGGFAASLDLPYEEIDEVRTCNVGPFIQFMPTGIKVIMKNGKGYKLSVLGRRKIAEYIQSKL
ncbi:MAG: PH domain-containing protein [Enterocloster asparagiformis]|nr:PH domain-containing protein [Enterocloster asparagiformis]